MENETKAKRGRPRLETKLTDECCKNRLTSVNLMYAFEGAYIIRKHKDRIPGWQKLYYDETEKDFFMRHDILEQIGRLYKQNHADDEDCINTANLAIEAIDAGVPSKVIEKVIRKVRICRERLLKDLENDELREQFKDAIKEMFDIVERYKHSQMLKKRYSIY